MSEKAKKADKTMADYASVSLTTQAGQGQELTNIVIQAHVDVTQKPSDIDKDLDKLGDALNRQRIIAEIPTLERNIERDVAYVKQMEEDLERIDKEEKIKWTKSGRDVEAFKYNQKADNHRREALATIKKTKERIIELENKLQWCVDVRNGKEKAVKAA